MVCAGGPYPSLQRDFDHRCVLWRVDLDGVENVPPLAWRLDLNRVVPWTRELGRRLEYRAVVHVMGEWAARGTSKRNEVTRGIYYLEFIVPD